MRREFLLFLLILIFLAACTPVASTAAPQVIAQATIANPTETPPEVSQPVAVDGTSLDACALITQTEAEGALGKTTGAGMLEVTPPIYSCSYETSAYDLVQIVVVIYDDSSQALGAYQMAIDINSYPEIPDLGDRAYNAQPIFDVNVLKGNIEVSIDISDPSSDQEQLQKAIELARLALGRLP